MVPPTGENNSSTTGAGITIQIGDETFEYTEGSNGIWSSIFTNVLGTCPVFGCTDATLVTGAATDDGSCEFTSCVGCADAKLVTTTQMQLKMMALVLIQLKIT